jgi:tetratricopeptide (TPR) repeat protein
MVNYVNEQQGTVAVGALWRFGGNMDLIRRAVSAGFPIVIESGYDVDDLGWMGHYETVAAYDDASQTVWVYDSYLGLGDAGTGVTHSYAELDSWWRHFNRAWLILFPLDQTDKLREVLGEFVEPDYAATEALNTAKTEATANPADGWAWFNAGTSSVKLGHYHDAAIYYDEAFRQGLPYRLMWYMYGPYEAYYHVGRYQDVLDLADNTESTTPYVEEIFYWRGLALAALGRFDEALIELIARRALTPTSRLAMMPRR